MEVYVSNEALSTHMPPMSINGDTFSHEVQVDSEDANNQSASLDDVSNCVVVEDIFMDQMEDSNAIESGLTPEKGDEPPEKAPLMAQSSIFSSRHLPALSSDHKNSIPT